MVVDSGDGSTSVGALGGRAHRAGTFTSWGPASATTATGGSVWAWGFNAVGQLGDGTLAMTAVPKHVRNISDVIEVQGNGDDGFALTASGSVYDWGLGAQGNLGNGTSVPYSKVPVLVTGLSGVTAVAGSGGGSTGTGYALESDGTVWAWGYGTGGALGNGSDASSSVPVQVSGLTNVTAIAGGGPIGGTAYALESDGTVWSWGVGADGELGDGSKASTSTPVQVRGITNAVSIAAGELGGYAVLQTGTVVAWGEARIGTFQDGSALGDGSFATTDVPSPFANSRVSPTSRPVAARRSPSPRVAECGRGATAIWVTERTTGVGSRSS
jgi:alpha-tubulin suppressor-like RCC1 family protein